MQPDPFGVPQGAAELDVLRQRILAVDARIADLAAQRQALVGDYERIRFALMGTAPPPVGAVAPPVRQEWSGARVRGLLLGLGAALLAISALAFTAVAWSRLGDAGRATLLIGATVVVTGLALALRRRLPASAEALAGLAVVLSLVDFYALRRAGVGADLSWQVWWAIGCAAAAGFAAALSTVVGPRTTRLAVAGLLPLAGELLAGRVAGTEWIGAVAFGVLAAAVTLARIGSGPRLAPREHGVLHLHAVGSWLAAAVLAALAAGQAQTVAGAVGPACAVAVLAAAPAAARRDLTDAGLRAVAATLVWGVPAGVLLTLAGPALSRDAVLTTAVLAGGATVLVSLLLPAGRRAPAMVAGAGFAAPGVATAVMTAVPAVISPLNWLRRAWTGAVTLPVAGSIDGPLPHGSWPAVGTLVTVAAVGLLLGIRKPEWLGLSSAAIAFTAALAPVTAGASIGVALVATTAAAVVGLLGAAVLDRAGAAVLDRAGSLRRVALLPGPAIAAVAATGWAAVSPGASVATLAVGAAAAGLAMLITRPVPAAQALFAGVATVLVALLAGVVTRAAGADPAVGGFAAAVAAGTMALAGVYLLRRTPMVAGTVEAIGGLCALCAFGVAAQSTPWLAGALTAAVPIAALAALRPDRRQVYAIAAGVLALGAVWAWLSAADVGVVEAYTAPAAVAALAAGLLGWRGGRGRSWVTLGPALVLAIGPTLLLGLSGNDGPRLVVAAVLSFAAVVAGAVGRLQAPLGIGAAVLLTLGIDQWGDEIVRLPRWITIGVIGVALMWIGATFEHRRRDWRRASDALGRFG